MCAGLTKAAEALVAGATVIRAIIHLRFYM